MMGLLIKQKGDIMTLSGRALEDFQDFQPILKRQLAREVAGHKKALVVESTLCGLHYQAQQALVDDLLTYDIAAYKALHQRNIKTPFRATGKTKEIS